jgi:hypothetical protein
LLLDFTRDKIKLKQALDSLRKRTQGRRFGKSQQFSALLATMREAFNGEDIRPIVIFQTDGDELFALKPSEPPIFSIPPRGKRVALPGDSDEISGLQPSAPPVSSTAPRRNRAWIPNDRSFSLRDVYLAIEKSHVSVYTVIPSRPLIESQSQTDLRNTRQLFGTSDPDNLPDVAYRRWEQIAAAGAAIGGWSAYLPKPEDAADIYRRILDDINSRYVIGYYPSNKTRDGKRRKVTVQIKGHPEYSIWGRKSYIAPETNN